MPKDPELWYKATTVCMQVIISLFIIVTGAFIILSGDYPDSYVKGSIGLIGLVIGYWLK